MQRVGRARDIERVDAERALAVEGEFLPRTGLVREHEHTVDGVEHGAFLGDEVQPVANRVDEQHVGQGEGGEGAGVVIADREHNGCPAVFVATRRAARRRRG